MQRLEAPQSNIYRSKVTSRTPPKEWRHNMRLFLEAGQINDPQLISQLAKKMLIGIPGNIGSSFLTYNILPSIYIYDPITHYMELCIPKTNAPNNTRSIEQLKWIIEEKESSGLIVFCGASALFTGMHKKEWKVDLINTYKTKELQDPTSTLSSIARRLSYNSRWVIFPNGKSFIADINTNVHTETDPKIKLTILKALLTQILEQKTQLNQQYPCKQVALQDVEYRKQREVLTSQELKIIQELYLLKKSARS